MAKTKTSEVDIEFMNSFCITKVLKFMGVHLMRGQIAYCLLNDDMTSWTVTTNFDPRRFVITRDIYADEFRMVVGTETHIL
jgi:hypothetical protein